MYERQPLWYTTDTMPAAEFSRKIRNTNVDAASEYPSRYSDLGSVAQS